MAFAGATPVPEDEDLEPPPGYSPAASRQDESDFADFQRWLQERRQGPRRLPRDDDDEDGDDQYRTNAGPPPTWDGVSSAFEDYLIRARIWCSTTKARPRARGPLLLKALADTPFQDFKYLAKDSSWLENVKNADILLDKMNSPEYYGDDQEEHLLSALSRVTYHMKRQKQETARQFLARWEIGERKVKEHKVDLPSVYRGFLLINALGLTENDTKALLNYTHGSIEPNEIRTWLRKHETKLQASQLGAEAQGPKAKTSASATSSSQAHLVEEATGGKNEAEDGEIEELETLLADLAASGEEEFDDEIGPLEEAETAEILSVMLKERKKKTFVQSNQIKKERELSRGYGARSSTGHAGPMKPGVYKLSISELKSAPVAEDAANLATGAENAQKPPTARRPRTSWRSSWKTRRTPCSAITWSWRTGPAMLSREILNLSQSTTVVTCAHFCRARARITLPQGFARFCMVSVLRTTKLVPQLTPVVSEPPSGSKLSEP